MQKKEDMMVVISINNITYFYIYIFDWDLITNPS